MKLSLKHFSLLITLIFTISIVPLSASTAGNESTTTKVIVIEGKVICFDIPEALERQIAFKKTAIGRFTDRIDAETGKADLAGESVNCYIIPEYRDKISDRLQAGVYVYLLKNTRKIKKTDYDIIAIGEIIRAGYEYTGGMVRETATASNISPNVPAPQVPIVNQEETSIDDGDGEDTPPEPPPVPPIPPPEPEPPPDPEPAIGPTAVMTTTPSTGVPPLTVKFDGSGSTTPNGSIDSYSWDFGDGNTDTGATVTHVYTTAGTYTATLVVSDSSGLTDATTETITASTTPLYYYVDQVNGSDSNDGSSSSPWKTITYASRNANSSVSTTIYIAAGTYDLANGEQLPITVPDGMTLDGSDPSTCIIDGSGGTSGLFFCQSITTTLKDMTIQNGTSSLASQAGGITLDNNADVTIESCTITSNTGQQAGGILAEDSTLTMTDSVISNNTATGNGGGINLIRSSGTISNTSFSTNSATKGGGLQFRGEEATDTLTLDIQDCRFSNNNATDSGGGMQLYNLDGAMSAEIRRTRFFDNSASGGAGIFCRSVNLTVLTSIFTSNGTGAISTGIGTGLPSSTSILVNCTFNGNVGGVINMLSGGLIRNCIITSNTGFGIVDNIDPDPTIDSNDIYNNSSGIAILNGISYTDSSAMMTNFNTALGLSSNLNIWVDPQFKNVSGSNYHLSTSSPASVTDGGNPAGNVVVDLDGRPYDDAAPSMGCFEYYTGDPPITGRIYDAVTGTTIPNPVVAIYQATNNTQLAVTTDNPYTFNVEPGSYFLAVSKDGYGFPSQIAATTTSGDHGDIFIAANDPLNIDIPMDSDGWLSVEKVCNKERVEIGDIVTYHITVNNNHWYETIENIELVDEIVNGFKYVTNSTLKNKSQLSADKIQINNRKAIFNFSSVPPRSTNTLSYQVRVGSSIPPGRYKATAATRKATTLERNSNQSSVSVEVVDIPLFTKGTIIGKVFWDINNNGIQDNGEPGIAGVKIYTEYGVTVETDELGKYHLADVPPGRHLLKIDSSTFPDYATFTTDNPYFVKITEGLLAKVNFGIQLQEKESSLPAPSPSTQDNQTNTQVSDKKAESCILNPENFFIVGLAEGTLSNLDTSDNIEMVDKDDRFDDGVHVEGRLAFYLKGKVLGKFLITASVDTDRKPKGRYDTRKLFTNLDPDKYYPVYGDASKVDYAGVDTQDMAYVLIEWDESFAKWGSFHTEMPLYNRTLSGGIVNYQSVGKTKFGDAKTKIKGFGAFSRQKPAHDEFVGTGGSLYYLRQDNVIQGSEKIRVEVRDRLGKITMSSIPLNEEMDYEIDYDRGRIILKKPLNGVQQSYNESIISNDILMGEQVYLVVDYEYYGGGLSEQTWGVNASQWVGNHFRLGGTFVEEQKVGDNYQLAGGDATVKINNNTEVNVYYNHTENTQLGSNMSYDGGLTFNEQGANYSMGKSGSAVGVNGKTKLFNNTDVFLAYFRQDPFYSVSNSISSQGSHKYLANIITKLTDALSFGVKHITQKYYENTIAESIFGATDSHTTTAILDYRTGKWDLRGEYQHQTVNHPITDYTYFGSLPLTNNNFIAARAGYQLFKWFHPYVRGQLTVTGESNNQGTIGADISIGKYTKIHLAETVGTLGDSTLLGVTSSVTEGTDIYANLEVGNHAQLGKYTKTTYGHSTLLSPDSRAYVEQDYSSYRENMVRGHVVGYNRKIADTLALGISYERSNVNHRRTREVIDRDSGSISLSWLYAEFLEGIKLFNKLECRNDRGNTVVRQWMTENDLLCRITKALTISGRGNWGWSEDRTNDINEAEFYEVGAGFSYRPVTWDRLNILGKYNYLTNLPPNSQYDFPEETNSHKNIYSLEGIFDLCRYLQLVGKIAYRDMKEKVGNRNWTHSDTYLYLGRTNFHIMNSNEDKPFLLRGWDFAVEYRILHNTQIEDNKKGFLVELDKDLGNYIRMGVGYNFTDYDDDLRNADNWDAKGFFVRVNGKY